MVTSQKRHSSVKPWWPFIAVPRFPTMTIRQRILLLIALSFAALTLIGGFAVVQSRSSSSEVKTVTEGVVPSALQSVELMGQLKDVQIAALSMVSADSTELVAQAHTQLKQKKSDLEQALKAQFAQAETDTQRGLVKQAEESLQNYFSSIDDTANYMLAGQKQMAEVNMAATVDQYLREQGSVIETLQIEKRRAKDQAIATVNGNLSRTTTTLSVATVVAVLALCAIGLLLYRQIIHPMADMERKMTAIATTHDYSQRMPVQRQDEIGRSIIAFNAMIGEIQTSAELVRQKSADIQAMLHYIPQGILTIQAGGTVHPEYSEHLRHVLETEDIAGRKVMDVVFGGTDLGVDALDQIDTALGACIGEDAMNFEFNAHLLPREIVKTLGGGRQKVLDLNWSPITDASDTTLRILLCVRDVTELRALAHAADAQKRELAIIGEILAVRQEKFQDFVASAQQFLNDNAALIRNASNTNTDAARADTVGLLFRNMHTIKGNARTYGLLHLTQVVHQAEQRYDQLRQSPARWDTTALLAELEQVDAQLQDYAHINDVKLGRKGPGRRADVARFLLAPKDAVAGLLETVTQAEQADARQQAHALRQVRNVLRRLGTEDLPSVLAPLLDALPSLAKELGKAPPNCTLNDHGIVVQSQWADLLRNVFMHLYRNALDHGLETADQRTAHGKPAAGHIHLEASLNADTFTLVLRDDGRGLPLQSIWTKAQQQGLLPAHPDLHANDVAQLIFAPGFSTASAVTEVSGRGVGMDAVRGFVEAEGGSIGLTLRGGGDGPGLPEFCAFETTITLPARGAVPADT
jgi:two-component system, chemotaxis family, sensor kinase CheA